MICAVRCIIHHVGNFIFTGVTIVMQMKNKMSHLSMIQLHAPVSSLVLTFMSLDQTSSQISADGSVVPTSQHQYIWIDTILQKLQRPVNLLSPIPSYFLKHLNIVVGGLHTLAGDNVVSGVYLLGKLGLLHAFFLFHETVM